MKTASTLFLIFFSSISMSFGQSTTCAGAMAGPFLTSGSCLTNQNATVAATAANCGGGFNSGVGLFYKFTAGTCSQFDLVFNAAENIQYLLWSSACVNLAVECSQTVANLPNSESFSAAVGPTLVNGTTYVIEILTETNSNFSICFNANMPEAPSNECSGALGLSPSGSTFNNGGNCEFTGSLNDGTTSDPAPGTLCAGSLENTQWVTFSPTAGSTSFQIIGTNTVCAGPVCKWQFGIFSGSCAGLTSEGCVSNGAGGCVNGPDPSSQVSGSALDGFALTWSGVSATGYTATITRTGGGAFIGTEVFYLVMDGNANSDCNYTLTGANIQPLPIELISFFGIKYNDVNMIKWEVASEVNNDYFSIERSLDGNEWETIQVIDGAGNSTEQRKYAILDERFSLEVNYYRLKQTDFDGAFEISQIISIDNRIMTKEIIAIHNFLGENVTLEYSGIKIIQYSDGTIEKRY